MNIRLPRVIIPLFALTVLLLALGARAAEPLQFAGKLLAADGSSRDYFGYALDADGDTAVAGAVRWNNPDDPNSDYQGAAYVFTRDAGGWSQRKQLVLADGMTMEGFGGALSLDGDTLAVGAFGVNVLTPTLVVDAGAVFVYTGAGETWTEPVKIMPGDLVESNRFGTDVALSGDTLLAGAPNVDGYANEAAYVYRRNGATWTLEDKFLPPTGAADFGASVALSGDTALVCAPGSTAVPTVAAVVSVYKRAGAAWSPAGELAPDTVEPFYGCGLAFDGQTAVMVTRGPGDTPTSTAYVFAYDGATWTQTAVLSPELNADTVLTTADAAGDRIVLGSYTFDEAGQVFVYERDGAGWSLAQPLQPPNPTVAATFGQEVALAGDSVLVSAPEESVELTEEQGVVYVFGPGPTGDYIVHLPVLFGPPAAPAPTDLIVYTDQVDSQTDIFTIRPDGTGKTNITQSPEDESSPRWSPDGQTILFGRYVGSGQTPMLMNPDGSNERSIPLPADQVDYYGEGTWAPDGTKIAFTGFADGSYEYDLFTIDVDGANLTNLTANFDNDAAGPAWSPDGAQIVFRIEEPEIDMLILDVASGQATPLNDEPTAGYYFDWSPDGALILFTDEGGANRGLHVIPPAGGESELRVPGGFYGRWSADGANLVFSGESGGIFRSAADGSGLTPVDPSESAWEADW